MFVDLLIFENLEVFYDWRHSTLRRCQLWVLILLGTEYIYIYILIYQELYSNLCETFDSQL